MLKSPQELAAEARKDIPEVQVSDVKDALDKGASAFLLVDVREPHEQVKGVIPGAAPIPRGILELQITKLTQNENQPIVCYCGGGTRSLFAAQQLKRMGFTDVKSMAGGFGAWQKSGNQITIL